MTRVIFKSRIHTILLKLEVWRFFISFLLFLLESHGCTLYVSGDLSSFRCLLSEFEEELEEEVRNKCGENILSIKSSTLEPSALCDKTYEGRDAKSNSYYC